MARRDAARISRRRFLRGAAAGGAALVAAPPALAEQTAAPARPSAAIPSEQQLQADVGALPAPTSPRLVEHPGSDFMVDVLKTLNLEFAAQNPGSSFEGLHESIVNYGGNAMPELLTCCHEESAVAMAHGYA